MRRRTAKLCLRFLWGAGWLSVLVVTATGASTRPDYESARKFGFQLQLDYAKRQSAALIERLDESAIRKRAYAAYTDETTESAAAKSLWDDALYPELISSLKGFDPYRILILGRVMNLDGARTLECELINEKGQVQLVYFDLQQGPDGKISIVDRRLLGESLKFTTRVKQMLLLYGLGSTAQVGEEDMNLEIESHGQHATIRFAIDEARRNANVAYHSWESLSESLKETTVWKEYRYLLAQRGATAAAKNIETEILEGRPGVDPLLKFNYAVLHNDDIAAARAIDEVLAVTYDAPLFLALKCDLLTRTRHPKEGLRLATETYRLNPYSISAYAAAVDSAVALNDTDSAINALRAWRQVSSPEDIEQVVKSRPGLASFRESAAFQNWLKATPVPPAS